MKVKCNRADDSICPLKNKCSHFKVHKHKGSECTESACSLDDFGNEFIVVLCIEIEEKKNA